MNVLDRNAALLKHSAWLGAAAAATTSPSATLTVLAPTALGTRGWA